MKWKSLTIIEPGPSVTSIVFLAECMGLQIYLGVIYKPVVMVCNKSHIRFASWSSLCAMTDISIASNTKATLFWSRWEL